MRHSHIILRNPRTQTPGVESGGEDSYPTKGDAYPLGLAWVE